MKASERREKILIELKNIDEPLSASVLAAKYNVSRQVIVGDVALLRASGEEIAATPRGYIAATAETDDKLMRIACIHSDSNMQKELNICVDFGCSVLDVIVEHPIYGELTGQLQLNSRYDVDQFMNLVKDTEAKALSELTSGVHLHTLRCPSKEAYLRVVDALKKEGILYNE